MFLHRAGVHAVHNLGLVEQTSFDFHAQITHNTHTSPHAQITHNTTPQHLPTPQQDIYWKNITRDYIHTSTHALLLNGEHICITSLLLFNCQKSGLQGH